MRWDEKKALECEKWENSRQGRFALEQKRRLLRHLCAAWPRKKNSLLEIGCCTGYFLQAFHEEGFRITGVDASPVMLKKARARLGRKADLHLGSPDYLPFEDNEYDYVLLSNTQDFTRDTLQAVLKEAFRIGKNGIALAFVNRRSCFYLSRHLSPITALLCSAPPSSVHCWTWREMRQLLNQTMDHPRLSRASVLPGPLWTWQNRSFGRILNAGIYPLACGAYCAVRVDYARKKPLNPLLAWNKDVQLRYPKTKTLTSEFFSNPSCSAGMRMRPSAWSMVFSRPDFPISGTATGRPPFEEASIRTRT